MYLIKVPSSLKKKYFSSEISRDIFFIDSLKDLIYCAHSNNSYHLIRSSALLRTWIANKHISDLAEFHKVNIDFRAFGMELEGEPLHKERIKKISENLKKYRLGAPPYRGLNLMNKPSKQYSLENFCNKICFKFGAQDDLNFSVENIILLVANKHGGTHIEFNFNSSNMESFHFGEFNPFSLSDDSVYLKYIKDIILIYSKAVTPLADTISKKLLSYDQNLRQYKTTHTAEVITREEAERRK